MSGFEIAGVVLSAIPLVLELYDRADSIAHGFTGLSSYGFKENLGEIRSLLHTQKTLFRLRARQLSAVIEWHKNEIAITLMSSPTDIIDDPQAGCPGSMLKDLLYSCYENLIYIQGKLRSISAILSKFPQSKASFHTGKIRLIIRKKKIRNSIEEIYKLIAVFTDVSKGISDILNSTNHGDNTKPGYPTQTKIHTYSKAESKEHKKVQHASIGLYQAITEKWYCTDHDYHIIRVSSKDDFSKGKDSDVSLSVVITTFTKLAIQKHLLFEVVHERCYNSSLSLQCEAQREHSDGTSPNWVCDFTSRLEQGVEGILPSPQALPARKRLKKPRNSIQFHTNTPINISELDAGQAQDNSSKPTDNDIINLDLVGDLCSYFEQRQPLNATRTCLGYLQDQCNQLFLTPSADDAIRGQPKNLSNIISTSSISLPPIFPRSQTIRLARSLADITLQFNGTPWLPERWGTNDISFFCTQNEATSYVNNIEHLPYITSKFGSLRGSKGKEPAYLSEAQDDTVFDNLYPVPNEQLFSLGVALLEIGYVKPWASLRSEIIDTLPLHQQCDYYAAKLLARGPQLVRQMGPKYTRVVFQCVKCQFGSGGCDLGNEQLQGSFVEDVIEVFKSMEEGIKGLRASMAR